jgi:hypothetical protein
LRKEIYLERRSRLIKEHMLEMVLQLLQQLLRITMQQ